MFMSTLVNAQELISTEAARAATLFPTIPRNAQKESWSEWSGRAALDWKFAEDQLVYVSASRGFKGGEFNGGALLDISEATIADPEFLNNYELGYKGTFLDRRLRFDITGFFMEYDDQQVLISNPTPFGFLPSLQNAGASEIKGFEFELHAQPTENWYLQVGGGYLDAEFTEFFDPAIGLERAGNKLPHAPEWNFNAIVRYETPLQDGSLGLQLDGFYNRLAFDGIDGHTRMIGSTANALFSLPGAVAHPYLIGGVGVYNMQATLDGFGSGSDTKFGFNGGLGVDVGVGSAKLYAEGRLHAIMKGTVDSQSLEETTAYMVPLTVGLRWSLR